MFTFYCCLSCREQVSELNWGHMPAGLQKGELLSVVIHYVGKFTSGEDSTADDASKVRNLVGSRRCQYISPRALCVASQMLGEVRVGINYQ